MNREAKIKAVRSTLKLLTENHLHIQDVLSALQVMILDYQKVLCDEDLKDDLDKVLDDLERSILTLDCIDEDNMEVE